MRTQVLLLSVFSLFVTQQTSEVNTIYQIKAQNVLIAMDYRPYTFNPYPAKLFYLNCQPLDAVSLYRDQQPQVLENYSYLFNLKPTIF